MAMVRRIFHMIGGEGMTMHAVMKTFEREGIRDLCSAYPGSP